MAPLKSLLSYFNPSAISQFTTCPDRCEVCQSYYIFFPTILHHPIIPCMMYRCVYAIFAPHHLTVYIGQTGATYRTLNQRTHNHRFLKHQTMCNTPDLSWQILLLLSPRFTTSSRTSTEPETRILARLSRNNPTIIFTQDTDYFYNSFSKHRSLRT